MVRVQMLLLKLLYQAKERLDLNLSFQEAT